MEIDYDSSRAARNLQLPHSMDAKGSGQIVTPVEFLRSSHCLSFAHSEISLGTNSRKQQEIVTLSLQLLQNCLMLINTMLLERTIEREGLWERLSPEDLRALTPLFHGHINPYGQFALDLARPSFLEVV